MNKDEAMEWLAGERSMVNLVPVEPLETRDIRIAQAEAAKCEQAYWVLRAMKEDLLNNGGYNNAMPFQCTTCGVKGTWAEWRSNDDKNIHRCDACHHEGNPSKLVPV